MNKEIPNCDICGEPLVSDSHVGGWTDDNEYGDVHVDCLEKKQNDQ